MPVSSTVSKPQSSSTCSSDRSFAETGTVITHHPDSGVTVHQLSGKTEDEAIAAFKQEMQVFAGGCVRRTLDKHYHQPDHQAAWMLLSALAAHKLAGSDPVWVMLVAPPGSMKTELLHSLKDIPGVHLIDEVTPQTFISGLITQNKKPGKAPASLLHRIGKSGVIVFADFSTVLELRAEARGSILSQMRRIYDGRFRREVGHTDTDGKPEWEGRITFLTGVTPVIDQHYGVFQALGERFILVRMSRPEMKAAFTAMKQVRSDVKSDLKAAVTRLMDGVVECAPEIPVHIEQKLVALAEFAVRARTHVARSGYTKEMLYSPEPEAPTRLAQQLAQLCRGSAALESRSRVDMRDYELAVRAGMDSIPARRRKALDALRQGLSPNLPDSSRKYVLEDLEELGLVADGKLSTLAKDLIQSLSLH